MMMMENKIMKNITWWKVWAMTTQRATIKKRNYEKCVMAFLLVLVQNNGSAGNKYSLE